MIVYLMSAVGYALMRLATTVLLVAAAMMTFASGVEELTDEPTYTTLSDEGDVLTTEPEEDGQWEIATSGMIFTTAAAAALDEEQSIMTVDSDTTAATADHSDGVDTATPPAPATPLQLHGGMKSTGALVNSSTSSTVDLNGTVLHPSPSNGGHRRVHVLRLSASGATVAALCVTALACIWTS